MTNTQNTAAQLAKAYAGVVALARARTGSGDLVARMIRDLFSEDVPARPDHNVAMDWLRSVASEKRMFRATGDARAAKRILEVIDHTSRLLDPSDARDVWSISIELSREAAREARAARGSGEHRAVIRTPEDFWRVMLD